jgi:ABC-2 type transport system ATP-binding protein
MSHDPVITTHNLTRYFGTKVVVDRLSITVPRGCVFGFLGRNGAGKTTTIRMLLGLLAPTRGSATVLDHDCTQLTPQVRARIGYLAEAHPVYGWMTVREAARFQAAFFDQWQTKTFDTVIDHFGLSPDAKAKDLSRGERAGLALALTLAPQPELLILDDPALGLDPVARRSLLELMIYVTRKADRTILFSSHLLSDVERVADEIAVLDDAVLRAHCSLETFRRHVRQVVLKFTDTPPALPPIPGLLHAMRLGNELRLTIANYDDHVEQLLTAMGPTRIEPIDMNLEDAFIDYLGRRGEKTFVLEGEDAA